MSGADQSIFTESGTVVSQAVALAFRNVILNKFGSAIAGAVVSGVKEFIRRLRGGTLDLSHETAHIDMSEETASLDLLHEVSTVTMSEEVRK